MPIQKLRLDEEKRHELERVFRQEIAFAVSERHELEQRWARHAEIYEARSVKVSIPWPNACGISVPTAATHADSIKARLVNSYFGQAPTWIVKERQEAYKEFARETEKFLSWVSEEQIKFYPKYKQIAGLQVNYGTALTYTPWVTKVKKMMQLVGDQFQAVERTVFDGPQTFVIPPWNFLIRGYEDDLQEAQWCGYKVRLTPGQIKEHKRTGFFYAAQADELLARFHDKGPWDGGHERDPNESRVVERREQLAGITRTNFTGSVILYHMFARYEIDGFESEIDFFFDPRYGTIPRAQYLDTPLGPHGQLRPFDKWGFIDRGPGVFWDIGVLELLEGLSDASNTIIRQVIDNNFVMNTKFFTILNTSQVKPGQAIRPGKNVYVGSHEEIQERAMGAGTINSSLNDVGFIENAMQMRTGLNDPNLGQESGKRVPATTILTLIQEGQKRLDLHIRDQRYIGGEYITKIAELFHQKKPMGVPFEVNGPNGEVIQQAWVSIGEDVMRKRVMIKSSASTAVLNKSVDRQEKSQAFALLAGFYDRLNKMLEVFFHPQIPPGMKAAIPKQYEGLREIMHRILSTHDFPDPDVYLPLTKEVFGGPAGVGGPANGGIQGANPSMESLMALVGTPGVPSGPGAALGRPIANVPRPPGTTPRAPPAERGVP